MTQFSAGDICCKGNIVVMILSIHDPHKSGQQLAFIDTGTTTELVPANDLLLLGPAAQESCRRFVFRAKGLTARGGKRARTDKPRLLQGSMGWGRLGWEILGENDPSSPVSGELLRRQLHEEEKNNDAG